MIKKLSLRFGPTGHSGSLVFQPGPVTVFVGANNTGKSLTLRELTAYCEQGRREGRKIIDTVEISIPAVEEADAAFQRAAVSLKADESLPEGTRRVTRLVPGSGRANVQQVNWRAISENLPGWRERQREGELDWQKEVPDWLFSWYVSLFSISLDGRKRLSLVDEQDQGDLLATPANHLAALFANDEVRHRLQEVIYDAFGLYFVIDPTNGGRLRVRLSARRPTVPEEEQALDARARQFHSQAVEISSFSDGVKAFCGLMSALACSEYRIIMVDEPDAFLHPTLGRKLGREMARIASEREGNVFVSTHSAAFLMGCMESGKPVDVVRLTYDEPDATARLLSSESVRTLMTDPLLRSVKVLEALFYRCAVITESDSDRALYDEINHRLEQASDQYARDAVFLNAHNKQTIGRVVGLLRGIGIPAAAVVDIDILKGRDLKNLMDACYVPAGTAIGIGQTKSAVIQSLQAAGDGWEMRGIDCLSAGERETCENLLAQLRDYGIFVVPVGQLESWLTSIGAAPTKNKTYWLATAFDLLGTDPDGEGYITPGTGDVWAFVRAIAAWTLKRDRKGMPNRSG